jgi:LPS-assembly protein
MNSGTVLNPEFDPVETRTLLDQLEFGLAERGFTRFDTYHQVAIPPSSDPVSLVPRAGLRFTSYSDVSGVFAEDTDRAIFHGGLDASIKFSKEYDGVYSRALGLDGLRHIVQPYFRYSMVQGDELDERFPSIDRLTPTTRPRPIDLSRYPPSTPSATGTSCASGSSTAGTRNATADPRVAGHEHLHGHLPRGSGVRPRLLQPLLGNHLVPLPWLRLGLETQFDVMGEEEGFNETNYRR